LPSACCSPRSRRRRRRRRTLPVLGILLAFAAAAKTISIWRFRHGQIFK
jgi:hypothetical protein